MHLKRLEFVGFKSFATRTSAELPPGIVVVVGPNGSGKSNIADAVRWVLGEQSAKAVRARKPDEVIFAGSATRQPLGMAEVSLVLDNADGAVPLEYGDVRVTRRLYRSGDSEYLLNGSRVRLKDVTGTLLHAGLGPDSYSVIGQGSVDELILQRPEERRTAFENAADIRRHQVKLVDTRNKLAATQANLVRVQDVLAELTPHVRRLKTQADRAARAERIRAELHALSVRYYRHRLRVVRREEIAAEHALAEASANLEAAEQASGEARQSRDARESTMAEIDARLAALRPRVEAARERARAAERAIAVGRERRRALGEQATELRAEMEHLDRRIAELSRDEQSQQRRLDAAEQSPTGSEADLETLREGVAQQSLDIAELERQRNEERKSRDALASRVAAGEVEARKLDERLRSLEASLAVVRTRAEDAAGRVEVLAAALAHAEAEERNIVGRLDAAHSVAAAAEEARRLAAASAGAARERLQASAQQADRLHGALEALGAPGLAEPDTLPPAWADALEGLAVVGLATDLAQRIQPLDRLLRGYLARTVVMADDHDAREAHQRLTRALGPSVPAWAVLSLDGLLVAADGERQAEAGEADGATLADWRRKVQALEAERAVALADRQEAEAELAAASSALGEAEAGLQDARAELREIELAAAQARRARAAAHSERDTAEAQVRRTRVEVDRAAEEHRRIEVSVGEARRRVDAGHAEQEQAEARLRDSEQRLQALRDTAANDRTRLAEIDARVRQRAADLAAALGLLARIQAERRAAGQAREAAANRLEAAESELRATDQRDAALERDRTIAVEELQPLLAEVDEAERARNVGAQGRREVEAQLTTLQAAERAAHAVREATLVRAQKARDERERLEQEVVEAGEDSTDDPDTWTRQLRLGLDGPGAGGADADEVVDEDAARKRIAGLRREVRALGGAGDSVVEEFRGMSERHAFLEAESGDLRAAMANLREAAAELEGHMQARFAEIFDAVNAAFQDCFRALFGGGEAQLVLTQPEDLLATGVDIVARPPGKKLQGLLSLSGGERALTVVALLFGLLRVNPTPFCVLDEVDAALDEANVQRFAQLLAEFANQIQFVVVTHNRATMEAADAMYGVSMDDQGVSHVFSIQPRALAKSAARETVPEDGIEEGSRLASAII